MQHFTKHDISPQTSESFSSLGVLHVFSWPFQGVYILQCRVLYKEIATEEGHRRLGCYNASVLIGSNTPRSVGIWTKTTWNWFLWALKITRNHSIWWIFYLGFQHFFTQNRMDFSGFPPGSLRWDELAQHQWAAPPHHLSTGAPVPWWSERDAMSGAFLPMGRNDMNPTFLRERSRTTSIMYLYVSMPFYAYVSICAYYIAGLVHAYGISMNIPSDRLTKMHPVDKWDAHPSSLRSFHNFNTMQNWRCVHNTSMS